MPIILLIIGIVLIVFNYNFVKNGNNKITKKNNIDSNSSFNSILQENKEELTDYKIELGILRKDIAESLTELQEEILEIKKNLNIVKDTNTYLNEDIFENHESSYEHNNVKEIEIKDEHNHEISENQFDFNLDDGIISEIDFSERKIVDESNKTEIIKNLLQEGLTDDEICYKLSVSKGEILLVKNLFKN